MTDDIDIAPEPAETMEVHRAPNGHGWRIVSDGATVACFSTVADMAAWMVTYLGRLDEEAGIIPRKSGPVHAMPEPQVEPMPICFTREEEAPIPARIWRVFAGGRK